MTNVIVFAALSLAVGLVSIYASSAWLRATTYATLVAGLLLLWFTSLGLPRPEYLHVPNGTVLSYYLDEPNAIYLWLVPEGSAQPVALQLPWHDDVAGNLVDAARRRGNPGDSIKMTSPTDGMGLRTKPVFYVTHVRPLPPKATERIPDP